MLLNLKFIESCSTITVHSNQIAEQGLLPRRSIDMYFITRLTCICSDTVQSADTLLTVVSQAVDSM